MKKISYLFLALFIGLMSCDSDDDLPQVEAPPTNQFCYGDGTQGFDVIGSFRDATIQINNDVTRTNLTILGDGLMLNDMDEIEGTGSIIQLSFYGDDPAGFQTGTYEIDTSQEFATVSGAYALDFDSANSINTFLSLDDGLIRVSPYSTGFFIEIVSTDSNGDEFHGNYFGNVTVLP